MDIFARYKAVVENTDYPTVLEIGAAEGEDTVRYVGALVNLNRPFRYVAFEPDKRNISKIECSPVAWYIDLFPYAVGDSNRVATFHPSNFPYSGSVKQPKEHIGLYPKIHFEEDYDVGMVRLDDAMITAGVGKVDWIWCDVQGAEDLVLAGGQKTFARTKKFYTEYLEVEAYEGQIGRDEIHRRLPGSWRIVEDYHSWEKGGDVLVENLTSPV